jgi:hypothetical protein
MDAFTSKLDDGSTKFDAIFHKIRIPNGWKFYITLTEDGHIHTSFDMTRHADGWKLVPPVPPWIMEKEEELSVIINSNIGP